MPPLLADEERQRGAVVVVDAGHLRAGDGAHDRPSPVSPIWKRASDQANAAARGGESPAAHRPGPARAEAAGVRSGSARGATGAGIVRGLRELGRIGTSRPPGPKSGRPGAAPRASLRERSKNVVERSVRPSRRCDNSGRGARAVDHPGHAARAPAHAPGDRDRARLGALVAAQASFSARAAGDPAGDPDVSPLRGRRAGVVARAVPRAASICATAASACLLYGAIGAGVVLSVGVVVPRLLGDGAHAAHRAARASASALALFLVGGWGLARDIWLERSLERSEARAATLAREAERAQLLALRSHLDPHFLFNTLNAIAEWCRDDGEVAERAVLQLVGHAARGARRGARAEPGRLREEIALVETLFALHRLRDRESGAPRAARPRAAAGGRRSADAAAPAGGERGQARPRRRARRGRPPRGRANARRAAWSCASATRGRSPAGGKGGWDSRWSSGGSRWPTTGGRGSRSPPRDPGPSPRWRSRLALSRARSGRERRDGCPLRVLVADDEAIARKRLVRLLGDLPDVELADSAPTRTRSWRRSGRPTWTSCCSTSRCPSSPVSTRCSSSRPAGRSSSSARRTRRTRSRRSTSAPSTTCSSRSTGGGCARRSIAPGSVRPVPRRSPAPASLERLALPTRQGIVLVDPRDVTHAELADELVTVYTAGAGVPERALAAGAGGALARRAFVRVHRRALRQPRPRRPAGAQRGRRVRGGDGRRHAVEVSRQAARGLRKRLGLRA